MTFVAKSNIYFSSDEWGSSNLTVCNNKQFSLIHYSHCDADLIILLCEVRIGVSVDKYFSKTEI